MTALLDAQAHEWISHAPQNNRYGLSQCRVFATAVVVRRVGMGGMPRLHCSLGEVANRRTQARHTCCVFSSFRLRTPH